MLRIIGKEVFKNIVAMAFEMAVADKIMKKVEKGLLEFSQHKKYQTRFRDDEDVCDDISKLYKMAHTNKKHYQPDEAGLELEEGAIPTWYSKKKIALTVAGTYAAFARVVKYDNSGIIRSYLDIWMENEDYNPLYDDDNIQYLLDDYPTTTTVAIIQREIKEREVFVLAEWLDSIYEFRFRGLTRNRQVWEQRLKEMRTRQFLIENISQ